MVSLGAYSRRADLRPGSRYELRLADQGARDPDGPWLGWSQRLFRSVRLDDGDQAGNTRIESAFEGHVMLVTGGAVGAGRVRTLQVWPGSIPRMSHV